MIINVKRAGEHLQGLAGTGTPLWLSLLVLSGTVTDTIEFGQGETSFPIMRYRNLMTIRPRLPPSEVIACVIEKWN
jgi:hypothetical protein